MKKDLIFAPLLLLVGVVLCLLSVTGLTAHIVVSIVGVALLIVYAVLTKKEWKIPALEIGTRVIYGIALISGIVIMNVEGLIALAIIHRISAILFLAAMIVLLLSKVAAEKKD